MGLKIASIILNILLIIAIIVIILRVGYLEKLDDLGEQTCSNVCLNNQSIDSYLYDHKDQLCHCFVGKKVSLTYPIDYSS